jgi:biopolymer transport protein ExbD
VNKSNAELNATPLIDVFLVLLVMLIVTVPIATHSIRLDLPVGQPLSRPTVQTIDVEVEYDGRVFWNGEWIASDRELSSRFSDVSRAVPAPVVKVRPDTRTPYERVAQVLAAAQRAHVARLALSPVAE